MTPAQADRLRRTIAAFANKSRQRGERYFLQGRVLAIEHGGARVRAQVLGTDTYLVAWTWQGGDWLCDCSCPIGYDCKHAYAAARGMLVQPRRAEPALVRAAKPAPARDLAAIFAAERDPWRRRAIVGRLLAVPELRGISAYGADIEQLLEDPDAEILCWRLARHIAGRSGGPIPASLEPYRDRADVAQRCAAREHAVLVGDLLAWAGSRRRPTSRSLRFVWSIATSRAGIPILQVSPRLTTPRLQDEPRRTEQLRQLLGEAQRMPGTLPHEQEQLLSVFLDARARLGSWQEPIEHGAVAVAMLKQLDAPGPLMTWADDVDPEWAARAAIAPGAPLRFDHAPVRVEPFAAGDGDGSRLDLACVWPDGRWRPLREVVYLPGPAHLRASSVIVAEGACFAVVR